MKIWGSTKKQRMYFFYPILILWVASLAWTYLSKDNYASIFTCLTSTIAMMAFNAYLIFDNSRAERTTFFIRQHLYKLEEIASRFQWEFNDILCRSQIAGIMKDSLDAGSSKKYNYEVIDKTTSEEADKSKCIFYIYADGQFKESLIIVRTGVINNDFAKA
jgi:hypothetical protein